MNLSFLHANLALLGIAAAISPIIIHLLFKTKPKPILFPALQLIRARKTTTVKRLRLQHLVLLMLRIGLLALLGFALARPTLHSSLFRIDQRAPVAAALIFDTSPSMSYRHKGKTRLEEARDLALRMLAKLPEGSEATLIESAQPVPAAPIDVPAAIGRIKTIPIQGSTRHLNQALIVACRNLAKSQKSRREIYVFSDMAQSAWNLSDSAREELDQALGLAEAPIRVYCINVGVEKTENIALGELTLPVQSIAANVEFPITLTATNSGPAVERAVTLSIDDEVREVRPIPFQAAQAVELNFKLPPLPSGIHTGKISINAADAMDFDDVRYFTFQSRDPASVLLVSDDILDSVNFANAIAPENLRRKNRTAFAVYGISSNELASTELSAFDLVALLNAGTVPPIGWQRLEGFLQSGKGVFVALGERCDPASFNSKEAQAVLPARLLQDVRPQEPVYLAPDSLAHPTLARFQAYERSDMPLYPVFRYWSVQMPEKGSSAVLPYSNRQPALIERSSTDAVRGRCLLMTTAAHYRPPPYVAWNELPQSWSFVVLMDQIARYLSGQTEKRFNFSVGGQAVVDIDAASGFSVYSVTSPSGQTERFTVGPRDVALTIPTVKEFGAYRIDAAEGGKSFSTAISVNVPASESNLSPAPDEKLAELIGKPRLSIARDPDRFDAVVDEGRVGRELFAWVMFLVICLVCIEGYFANRFYRRPSLPPQLATA